MREIHLEAVNILIVEDNPSDAELMLRAFKKNKLANELYVAEDGEEALDFVFNRGKFANRTSRANPRVIFLDLKLPKVDGLEVLKKIKSNADTKGIPVIIVTSSREDPDIKAAYELGANSYVVKPVGFEDFFKAMDRLGFYWLLINEHSK